MSIAAACAVQAIGLYRLASRRLPRRRACLYRESCSRHVEATLRACGFFVGMKAMLHRFASCRPGYSFLFEDGDPGIICVNGHLIPSAEVSESVANEAVILQGLLLFETTAAVEVHTETGGRR